MISLSACPTGDLAVVIALNAILTCISELFFGPNIFWFTGVGQTSFCLSVLGRTNA